MRSEYFDSLTLLRLNKKKHNHNEEKTDIIAFQNVTSTKIIQIYPYSIHFIGPLHYNSTVKQLTALFLSIFQKILHEIIVDSSIRAARTSRQAIYTCSVGKHMYRLDVYYIKSYNSSVYQMFKFCWPSSYLLVIEYSPFPV